MNSTEAWCWNSPGEPEALNRQTVDLGALSRHDVLVENQTIAFNPVDWKLIEHGHSNWRPGQIPGVDGMGKIVAIGESVQHLRVGSRVAYHTDLRGQGSFARHTTVPARAVIPVPHSLSNEVAAAMPCPGLTAWQSLEKLPDLSGEAVLITGAAGSVGHFATQFALNRNMRVFATASAKHHEWLSQTGVQAAADYHDHDWIDQLRNASGGQPFAAIIDLVSADQATQLVDHLGYYGHIVAVLGRVEQNPQPAFQRCASLHEIALGAAHEFGSDQQWHKLVRAGESILAQLANGSLKAPPLKTGRFEELPSFLSEFKNNGQGIKHVVIVD
ncbi:zinc-binding dehydrogenase [Thalassoglobus sp. JC818]|uniref:zinc-binding dehydrogenase n=1 Tax=Thalassoglobus sp. JC818 TaxID=3232136 RepID=UPI003458FB13